MPEWIVYERNGKKRKALPHEIPKPIEHGCDLTDGEIVFLDDMKAKKRSDPDAHKTHR